MSVYELYHYGVKGMKWGVRHYQKYPKLKPGERRKPNYPERQELSNIKKDLNVANRDLQKSYKHLLKTSDNFNRKNWVGKATKKDVVDTTEASARYVKNKALVDYLIKKLSYREFEFHYMPGDDWTEGHKAAEELEKARRHLKAVEKDPFYNIPKRG